MVEDNKYLLPSFDEFRSLKCAVLLVLVHQSRRLKNKMATLASDWLRHFWLLLWNRWTDFNETWQEARSHHLVVSLCFSWLTPISRSAHERGATGSPAVHPLSHTQTDQTTNSGNSLHTGPDVSYLSESSPIPRWSKTPAQDPRPLKRGQTWRTPDKQRPPRSRRTPPPIVRDQLNTWINTG